MVKTGSNFKFNLRRMTNAIEEAPQEFLQKSVQILYKSMKFYTTPCNDTQGVSAYKT